MNPLHDAIEVARSAHEGLLYGDLPYMAHLEWVAGVLRWFGKGERLVVAGYLHDVLEDTPVSQHLLQTHFGDEVARLVWAVTGQGPTRKDRNRDAYQKIQQLHAERPDLDPTSLKLGDRIANIEECWLSQNRKQFAKYKSEYPEFRTLPGGDPAMWGYLDTLMGLEMS